MERKSNIQVALWAMFSIFLLNTVGNALSKDELEKIIFTPLTFILAIFSLQLALSKEPGQFKINIFEH